MWISGATQLIRMSLGIIALLYLSVGRVQVGVLSYLRVSVYSLLVVIDIDISTLVRLII